MGVAIFDNQTMVDFFSAIYHSSPYPYHFGKVNDDSHQISVNKFCIIIFVIKALIDTIECNVTPSTIQSPDLILGHLCHYDQCSVRWVADFTFTGLSKTENSKDCTLLCTSTLHLLLHQHPTAPPSQQYERKHE